MRQIINTWQDENAKDLYPFDDQSTLKSLDGTELDNSLIVDAAIHPAGVTSFAFLESVEISEGSLTFVVSDETNAVRCVGQWPMYGATDETVVPLLDQKNRPGGLLVLNPAVAKNLIRTTTGSFTFEQRAARFVPSVTRYIKEPIVTEIADGVTLPADGDVYLVGEMGVLLNCFSYQEMHDGELIPVTVVRVNAVGSSLSKRERCTNANFDTPRFIKEVVYQIGDSTHRCVPSGIGETFLVGMSPTGGETALRIQTSDTSIEFNLADGKDA